MSDTVQEFFQNLESRADSSKTAGMTNSYVFDIEGVGQWKVDVDDGKVTVTEGGGDADATISASQETFAEDRRRRAERDERLHDREAEGQGRHGRRDEAPEAFLGIKSAWAGADASSMIRRLLGLPRPHRSVPARSLRRYAKSICLDSQTRT